MLHPTEKKLSESEDLKILIEQFRSSGGVIVREKNGTSSHLKKSKYVKKRD